DFQVETVSYGGYMLPAGHPRLLGMAPDLERWFGSFSNPLGAFYLVVASKQRVPLIPVMPKWRSIRPPALGAPIADTGRVASGRGTVVPIRPAGDPVRRNREPDSSR